MELVARGDELRVGRPLDCTKLIYKLLLMLRVIGEETLDGYERRHCFLMTSPLAIGVETRFEWLPRSE